MLARIDLLVLLKLCAKRELEWHQTEIAHELGISQSAVHTALKRAAQSGLYSASRRAVNRLALEEALVHGVRYFFAPVRGGSSRGMPTAWAAPPLADAIVASEPPPVWPDSEGSAVGFSLEPLYPTAPAAARRDPLLYEYLALVDALREGSARERGRAAEALHARLIA